MDVAAVDLFAPAGADLDFTVAGGRAVTDDKLIGKAVVHLPDFGVIVVKSLCVALPRSAVVDDDVFPTSRGHFSAIDFVANGLGQVLVVSTGRPASTEDAVPERRGFWLYDLQFDAGLFDYNGGIWIWDERGRFIFANKLRGRWG